MRCCAGDRRRKCRAPRGITIPVLLLFAVGCGGRPLELPDGGETCRLELDAPFSDQVASPPASCSSSGAALRFQWVRGDLSYFVSVSAADQAAVFWNEPFPCSPAAVAGDERGLTFDAICGNFTVRGRLEVFP